MLLSATLATNSKALWYMTRGFGLVALLLLTMTMVLGLTQAVRFARPGWPRFVVSALHKNASLLAVAALAVHIVTAVARQLRPDPHRGRVHPVRVQVPAVLAGTGGGRGRLVDRPGGHQSGPRAARPSGLAGRALGRLRLLAGCGAARPGDRFGHQTRLGAGPQPGLYRIGPRCLVVAAGPRLVGRQRRPAGRRRWPPVSSLPLALAAWTVTGPLRPGWARKAGTPAALIGVPDSRRPQPAASSDTGSGGRPVGPAQLAVPLTASFRGTQRQTGPDSNGLVSVIIAGQFGGARPGRLTIVLTGQPASGGGVQLTGSQVKVGTTG